MRNISFIVAVATLVLASPSVAGSSQSHLPGAGAFSYSGSPVVTPAPAMVIAGLTKAERS